MNQHEMLGLRLLTLHNLRFLLDLTAARARRSSAASWRSFKAEALGTAG